jgi:RNA polymerase sigma-70 factor (ECF subfamily)
MATHFTAKTDKQTLFLLKQGDEMAFETIYWKYSAWVYNFFQSLLSDKSQAEDLTQAVFLKIWERHADIKLDENFEAYVFTIARNLISKETESRLLTERLLAFIQDRQEDMDRTTEENIETNSLREYINSLVEQLPAARKRIYQMSRNQYLSNKEIADKLSISEKTVETQLYRSLCFLKRKLAGNKNLLLFLLFLYVK